MKKSIFLLLILLIVGAGNVSAAKRYWISNGPAYWNNAANWASASGGAGGAGVPGSNDTAYFDGVGTGGGPATAHGNDTLDVNAAVKYLVVNGFTGKIVQGTFTLTIGSSGASLNTGTFSGGSGSITATGHVTISGTAFTSTSGTFSTSKDFTNSGGSFSHNNGKMRFTATNTITGSVTMYQLEFTPASTSTFTIASGTTLTVSNTLTISGSASSSVNTGDISVQGDLVITNTASGTGGTGTFTFNGTGNQLLDGAGATSQGRLPNVVINKPSGTLSYQDYINVTGNWTRTAGDVSPGTSTVAFVGTKTISCTDTLYDVAFSGGGTFTISGGGSTINVLHTFTNQGTLDQTFNTGTINLFGDIVILNTGTGGGGTATFNICGSANQTLDGSAAGTEGRFPNVIINRTGGTLYLQDFISVVGNWTRTAGDTDPGTHSTVVFGGTKTITGTDTFYNARFGGGTSTFTILDTLTINDTLTLAGNTFSTTYNTGIIYAKGDITIGNTGTSGGGTATIVMNGNGTQTLTGGGTAGGGRLPHITIDKSISDTLKLVSIISCAGNWIYTQGAVSPGTSTVAFYGTMNLDGQASGSTSCMPFYNITINGNTRTLTGNVDANNNFTIASGATCSAGSNKIYVGGDWNSAGTWTYGTSTVVFDGNGYNKIQGAAGVINFSSVELNRRTTLGIASKNVRLLNPVKINTGMTFNIGRVKSDTTNYLEFADNATCTMNNDDSAYVHGAVRKVGDDAFSFPLGDTTLHDSIAYHPLSMTAPSGSTHRFMAQYFSAGQLVGDSLVDSLTNLNNVEYWNFRRQAGSSTVYTTLNWNANSDNVSDYNNLRVANWNSTKWLDLGGTSVTATGRRGSVTATVAPTYVSNLAVLTIANQVTAQAYCVLHRKMDGGYYLVKNGALYFMYDEEYNDTNDELTFTIYDEQRRTVASNTGAYAIALTSDYGDNRFYINLFDCGTNANGSLGSGNYVLEVVNEKGEKWLLRFKHVTTITPNCPGVGGGGD